MRHEKSNDGLEYSFFVLYGIPIRMSMKVMGRIIGEKSDGAFRVASNRLLWKMDLNV